MKKRIILFVLSFCFILGFSINVNAATEIEVDSNTCLEDDPTSCLIVNKGDIYVLNDNSVTLGYTYKTIESYYNKNSNVITYKFTSLFEEFLASTKDTEYDYSELTVEEYAQMTGATEEEMESGSTQLINDLNNLYRLFGVYVRKNDIVASNSLGSSITNNNTVGTYFVIKNGNFICAPMVGNLQFEVNEDGEWELNPEVRIVLKKSDFGLVNFYIDTIENNPNSETFYNTSRSVGDVIKMVTVYNIPKYPVYAVSKLFNVSMTLDVGLDYVNDISGIEFEGVGQNFINDGNGNIIDTDTNEVVATLTYADKTILINFDTDKILIDSLSVISNIKLNSNATLGSVGNFFNLKSEVADDTYSDSTYVDDSEDYIKIYTYGLKINLTDKDDNTVFLPGAVFELYDVSDTENAIGTITIGEDGTATFIGISADSYILKQIKAPTGYHLNDDYTFTFSSSDIDEEGYYILNLTNQKYSLLPFTGGAGTLTYTLWGFILIAVSALCVVLYKRKQSCNS